MTGESMEETIIVYAIDCGRHDYWKVSIDLLCELKIIEEISGYSYVGNGNDPLNEQGFAYLEIDSDVGIFDKASEFYKKDVAIDMDTLTDAFNEKYDDYRQWLEDLTSWDTDFLEEEGYIWEVAPDDLKVALYPARCEECREYECMCEEDVE
jgi:hypothetical protein